VSKKYTITAALPYANGALHLGHLAGAYLPADIYARYLRLNGKDVLFVCGSDEHGAAITIRAKKEKRSPQEIIDTYHQLNKQTFEQLGISFDMYHRTSDKLHHQTAQDFFLKLLEKGGQFEEIISDQYYDEEYNQFLADRYITGICPKETCKNVEAFGDQCEKCGSTLSPTELINPVSTLSRKKPVLKKTKHWFFKLDKHAAWLKDWIDKGQVNGQSSHDPSTWKKHVLGQCSSWIDNGLHPRAITRDLSWGIPVPVKGAKGKVLYVWFDAPIGYISASKQWAIEQGKDWESYWKGDEVELVHFIGKDNIVFHCIVFPAMLKAHGDFALPTNVPANQFLNLEGKKFSKSKGWVIEQHQYLKDFEQFHNKEDALRYALIRTLPENKDGDFKWDEFVALHDNELVANLGNFVNRVTNLTHKNFEAKVPRFTASAQLKDIEEGDFVSVSAAMQQLYTKIEQLESCIQKYEFKQAIQVLMEISSYGNTLLQRNEPWKVWKQNPESVEAAALLNLSLQIVTALSVISQPFLPFTSAQMRRLLGLAALEAGSLTHLKDQLSQHKVLIEEGHQIEAPQLLFAKINDRKDKSRLALVEQQKEKLKQLKKENIKESVPENVDYKPNCTFDDFMKIDLRTGTIVTAEKIKKANKLLKLQVDMGSEIRTIVSGIAKHYSAASIVGQQVVVVANLAPRKMMGILSEGMILMAENSDGKLIFVAPSSKADKGSVVK
jgi:methionyl-tRNA synthetase